MIEHHCNSRFPNGNRHPCTLSKSYPRTYSISPSRTIISETTNLLQQGVGSHSGCNDTHIYQYAPSTSASDEIRRLLGRGDWLARASKAHGLPGPRPRVLHLAIRSAATSAQPLVLGLVTRILAVPARHKDLVSHMMCSFEHSASAGALHRECITDLGPQTTPPGKESAQHENRARARRKKGSTCVLIEEGGMPPFVHGPDTIPPLMRTAIPLLLGCPAHRLGSQILHAALM